MKQKPFVLFSLVCSLFLFSWVGNSYAIVAFSTDFNSGLPPEFSGITTLEGVQGYSGLGTGSNVFSGGFLRNTSAGNPASASILSLTGLPTHTSIDLNFLLAIIDSWDGSNYDYAPDILNVKVDGSTIFSETFDIFGYFDQSYKGNERGTTLTYDTARGFSSWNDAAYDMGLDPIFNNISHTSSTLTIEWFASGGGYQGGDDESWAIDNVQVILNADPIPEPATMLLLASGLVGLAGFKKRIRVLDKDFSS